MDWIIITFLLKPPENLALKKYVHAVVQALDLKQSGFLLKANRRLALISSPRAQAGEGRSHLSVSVYFACKACLL